MNKKNNEQISTPAWDRFANAVQSHISWLKEQEKKNSNFLCKCRICGENQKGKK